MAAAGQERLYELLYRGLGIVVDVADAVWWARVVGPAVFPAAGTLGRDAEPATLVGRLPRHGRVVVNDAWGCLDLGPYGLRSYPGDPWMVRRPGRLEVAAVPGLTVVRAATPAQVRAVEATVVEAAGGPPEGYVPGGLHPPRTSLDLPDLHLFLGLLDGVAIGTAMAAVGPGTVFVSGIAVMPSMRGRGIGSALTAAALGVATHLPAALRTTASGHGVYRRLGFALVGRPLDWVREG